MTIIGKLAISLFISLTSIWVLHKPPAPTPIERQIASETVWQGLEPASPKPPQTTTTTQANACKAVFDMAQHVGWPEHELATVVAVAYRESRCQPTAFNPRDPNGGSAGVMQINYFWCKPSRYFPNGYMQAYAIVRTCDDLFDLETNLRAALNIYRYSNGWRAWSL